jgi:hypothetical protein
MNDQVALLHSRQEAERIVRGDFELIRGRLVCGKHFRLIVSEPIEPQELRQIVMLIKAHLDVLEQG